MTAWYRASLLIFRSPSRLRLLASLLALAASCAWTGLPSRLASPLRVPALLIPCSTGISTCCPSATAPALALGPDLPREDQLYPGNLRYPAWRIPTSISLLIPAFSLPMTPPLLTVWLRRHGNAPLPTDTRVSFRSFGSMFQPRTFSAQGLSASELLRTLLMCGCF